MTELYFVDDEHSSNYEYLKEKWPLSLSSTEYQVSCYITAIPMLFDKLGGTIDTSGSPAEWFFRYLNDELAIDLTSSMHTMGILMCQLWNGSQKVDVLDCIGSFDKYNYRAFKCALDIRRGMYRGK